MFILIFWKQYLNIPCYYVTNPLQIPCNQSSSIFTCGTCLLFERTESLSNSMGYSSVWWCVELLVCSAAMGLLGNNLLPLSLASYHWIPNWTKINTHPDVALHIITQLCKSYCWRTHSWLAENYFCSPFKGTMLLRGSAAWEASGRMSNPPKVWLGYVCVTSSQLGQTLEGHML